MDPHRVQNTQVHIRHPRFLAMPIGTMPQAHIGAAGDQRRQIGGIMGSTRSTSIEHDTVVEYRAIGILEFA